jgi:membrane associated rhomboid family serine protease
MVYPQGPGSDATGSDATDSGAGVSAPRCYRHPGRETYVSCVRCGRPACPDCLRSAAVGQQCVDCVRDGNRGARQATGRFGGQVAAGRPVVTYTLVALCVLAYLAELITSKTIYNFEMVGAGVAYGQWYRLLTSAFLHYPPDGGLGLTHIVFNMWALIVVGPPVERMLGRARFLTIYLVSALAGSVLLYLIASPFEQALGASGAIFGLFGAYFILARRVRADVRQIVILIVLNLVITFTFHTYIAWQDHVGGLIAGSALTAAFVYAPRLNRKLIQIGATVGIVALLILGVVLRDFHLVHAVLFRL